MRKLILFLAAVSLVLFAEKALCYETTFSIEPESFNSFRYHEMRVEEAAPLSIRRGRFLSVDPEMNPEKIKYEPQQWNRYSYVTNNPLKYTDPDGRDKFMAWLGGSAFKDVSTWDALKTMVGLDHIGDLNEGRDQFHEDHQKMFRGYSPYPASVTDQVLLPLTMMLGPAGKGVARTTLAEAKMLIGKWAADPVKNTISASLRYYFKTHGAGVGAKNMLQYLRSASEFTRNLKGATKHVLDDGKIRYVKNNRYVILDADGKIVSYGAAR